MRQRFFSNNIALRGLLEISNICKNDCFYCGIRRSNTKVHRYRLEPSKILQAVDRGATLGFQTFVLQGGEDDYFTDEVLCSLISKIKKRYPKVAVTLSLGERSYESYRALKEAGADRYLLRHETRNPDHYRRLHPRGMSLERRLQCLRDLKDLGYQVGAGIMVGSPFQRLEHLAEDLYFFQEFQPHMVGIGPFMVHGDTPFRNFPNGPLEMTLGFLALTRLVLPRANLPATTALGTLSPKGRILGIQAGANVVMPNITPGEARKDYQLYDHKLNTGAESIEGLSLLREELALVGGVPDFSRTDHCDFRRGEDV